MNTVQNAVADYIAATIFWLYIAAALYLIFIVLRTIVDLPTNPRANQQQISKQTWRFASLASVSFAMLSFNMLNILTTSYRRWLEGHKVYYNSSAAIISGIWQWSLDTKPFRDFILQVFEDSRAVRASIPALVATLGLCLLMGIEGRRYQIPNLWAFFSLAQVLPVSFSSTLFHIAVVRSARIPVPAIYPRRLVLSVAAGFFTCILAALYLVRYDEDSQWLLPLVAIARLILLIPLAIPTNQKSNIDALDALGDKRLTDTLKMHILATVIIPGVFVLVDTKRAGHTDLPSYLLEHSAVSTLLCDILMAVGACVVRQRWPVSQEQIKA